MHSVVHAKSNETTRLIVPFVAHVHIWSPANLPVLRGHPDMLAVLSDPEEFENGVEPYIKLGGVALGIVARIGGCAINRRLTADSEIIALESFYCSCKRSMVVFFLGVHLLRGNVRLTGTRSIIRGKPALCIDDMLYELTKERRWISACHCRVTVPSDACACKTTLYLRTIGLCWRRQDCFTIQK